MKKKLTLNQIKVSSFVTNVDQNLQETIQGALDQNGGAIDQSKANCLSVNYCVSNEYDICTKIACSNLQNCTRFSCEQSKNIVCVTGSPVIELSLISTCDYTKTKSKY